MFDFLKSYASFAKKHEWKPDSAWLDAKEKHMEKERKQAARAFSPKVKRALTTIENAPSKLDRDLFTESVGATREAAQTFIRNEFDQREEVLLAAYQQMKTALEDVWKLEATLAAEKRHGQAMLTALQSNPNKEEEAKKFAISMKEKLKLCLQAIKKKRARLQMLTRTSIFHHA